MSGRLNDPAAVGQVEVQLGGQVRDARRAQGLTQLEVADLANTSVGALKNLESGRGANVRTLIRVLRALGLDDWLGTLYVPRPTFNPLDLPAVEVTAGRRVHDGRSVASMSDRDDS